MNITNPNICQMDRAGLANVNNSTTLLFHNHFPINDSITIEIINAKIFAINSIYTSRRFESEPDKSVNPSTIA